MNKIIILINLSNCIALSLVRLRYGDLVRKKISFTKILYSYRRDTVIN